jgi:hypothetical protein
MAGGTLVGDGRCGRAVWILRGVSQRDRARTRALTWNAATTPCATRSVTSASLRHCSMTCQRALTSIVHASMRPDIEWRNDGVPALRRELRRPMRLIVFIASTTDGSPTGARVSMRGSLMKRLLIRRWTARCARRVFDGCPARAQTGQVLRARQEPWMREVPRPAMRGDRALTARRSCFGD